MQGVFVFEWRLLLFVVNFLYHQFTLNTASKSPIFREVVRNLCYQPSKAIYLGFKANHFYWHFWDKLCIADSQIEDETCRVAFELFKSTLCHVKGVASAIGAESDLMRLNNKVGNPSVNS